MRRPAVTDLRVILPDLHGNFSATRKLLETVGALDEHGERTPLARRAALAPRRAASSGARNSWTPATKRLGM